MLELFPRASRSATRQAGSSSSRPATRHVDRRWPSTWTKRPVPAARRLRAHGRAVERLGGALAQFHRPRARRPALGRPAVGAAAGGRVAVVIDPGRAFGTGAHPTTRLCLELLLELEPRQPARRRLRLRRARDRGGEARLRAGASPSTSTRPPSRRRARTPRRTGSRSRRWRRRARRRAAEARRRGREHRARRASRRSRPASRCAQRSSRPATSRASEPAVAGLRAASRRRDARRLGGRLVRPHAE